MPEITVKDTSVRITKIDGQDYVCITDIAKYKNPAETALIISHWLSSRSTVEFLGIWETLKNPDFNTTEFSSIKNESGSNGFVLTTRKWTEKPMQ